MFARYEVTLIPRSGDEREKRTKPACGRNAEIIFTT